MSSLLPYAILAAVIGVVVLVFSARVGVLYGDSESRIDEYMIKDTALFITSLYALPGNVAMNFFYPIYERRIVVNASQVSIFTLGDEDIMDHFSYRTVGDNESSEWSIERSQEFDISKSGEKIELNTNNNLDALPCVVQYEKTEISFLQIYYTDFFEERVDTENLALAIKNSLSRSFNVLEEVPNIASGISAYDTDLSLIFSPDYPDSNDFIAFVHYENQLGKEVSCKIMNEIMSNHNIQGDRYLVYSIDPDFYKINGISLDKKTVLFHLGSKESLNEISPIIRFAVMDVLEEYK